MRATYLHYENGKGYDVIDFIKDYELNFNRGNIIKMKDDVLIWWNLNKQKYGK